MFVNYSVSKGWVSGKKMTGFIVRVSYMSPSEGLSTGLLS